MYTNTRSLRANEWICSTMSCDMCGLERENTEFFMANVLV